MTKRRCRMSGLAALITLLFLLTAGQALGEKNILLTFTGDCTLGGEERTRAREDSFDGYVRSQGYDYFFANFRDMFEADDCTIINLEGVLTDSTAMKRGGKTYNFRGPSEYAQIIRGSFIELCGLANNHISDYGAQGVKSTQAVLDEYGIGWCRGLQDYILEKDGIRIAFFAIDYGININDGDAIRKRMEEMKQNGEVNAIVILHHNGNEYDGEHSVAKQEKIAKLYVDCGADLVIMNHVHTVQGLEIYRSRTLCYALGNFVFGGNAAIRIEPFKNRTVTSQHALVVQATMTFSDSGKYLGQALTLYPAFSSATTPVNQYQPKRLNAEEAAAVVESVQLDTGFELPPVTVDEDGLTRINLPYLAAFDDVMIPDGDDDAYSTVPEAAPAVPTRDNRGD